MKVSEALGVAKSKVNSHFLAMRFMSFYLKRSREWIFLHYNDEMKFDGFFELINRYENGEPFEYITGICEFCGNEFDIGKGALIPRFETEILVENTINIAKRFNKVRIAEIGAGSAAIAITIALNVKNADIITTEISPDAIFWAKKNIDKFKVNINLIQTSLLDGVDKNFDIIVSNPPYIANDYKLDKWVLNEPHLALFGGEIGDEILKEIINLSKTKTKYLICEIGYDQKESMKFELEKNDFEYEFYKDLAGFDRGFIARNLNGDLI